MTSIYYKKYLKYKFKYLELKESMKGGGIGRCTWEFCECPRYKSRFPTPGCGNTYKDNNNKINICTHSFKHHNRE